jgi:hypothetical protein
MHLPKTPIKYFKGDSWTIVEEGFDPRLPAGFRVHMKNTLLVAIPIILVLASLMGCAPAATPTATALPPLPCRSPPLPYRSPPRRRRSRPQHPTLAPGK